MGNYDFINTDVIEDLAYQSNSLVYTFSVLAHQCPERADLEPISNFKFHMNLQCALWSLSNYWACAYVISCKRKVTAEKKKTHMHDR